MEGHGAFESGRESRSVIQSRYALWRNPVSLVGAAPKVSVSAGVFRMSLRETTIHGLKYTVFFVHISQIGASQELLASMILTGDSFRSEADGIRQHFGGDHHNAVIILTVTKIL